jgi:hypothetical protein
MIAVSKRGSEINKPGCIQEYSLHMTEILYDVSQVEDVYKTFKMLLNCIKCNTKQCNVFVIHILEEGRTKEQPGFWTSGKTRIISNRQEGSGKFFDLKTTRKAQTPYTLPATHFAKTISPFKMSTELMKRNTVCCKTSGGGGTSRDKERETILILV